MTRVGVGVYRDKNDPYKDSELELDFVGLKSIHENLHRARTREP